MDGASKYVRGDAMAGIMVTIVINVIGGLNRRVWLNMIWLLLTRLKTTHY